MAGQGGSCRKRCLPARAGRLLQEAQANDIAAGRGGAGCHVLPRPPRQIGPEARPVGSQVAPVQQRVPESEVRSMLSQHWRDATERAMARNREREQENRDLKRELARLQSEPRQMVQERDNAKRTARRRDKAAPWAAAALAVLVHVQIGACGARGGGESCLGEHSAQRRRHPLPAGGELRQLRLRGGDARRGSGPGDGDAVVKRRAFRDKATGGSWGGGGSRGGSWGGSWVAGAVAGVDPLLLLLCWNWARRLWLKVTRGSGDHSHPPLYIDICSPPHDPCYSTVKRSHSTRIPMNKIFATRPGAN